MPPKKHQVVKRRGKPHGSKAEPEWCFRFLDLPLELRLKVYACLFTCHRGFVRFFNKVELDSAVRPARVAINILKTCRQIREEGVPVLYAINNFCIMPLDKDTPNTGSITASRSDSTFAFGSGVVSGFGPDFVAALSALGSGSGSSLGSGLGSGPSTNAKWLKAIIAKSMERGRNNIRNLEIRLPFPDQNVDDLMDMSGLFPNLQHITFFFDSLHDLSARKFKLKTGDTWESFFTKVKALMPSAPSISIDAYFFMPLNKDGSDRAKRIVLTLLKVFNVAKTGTKVSAFMTQERRWEKQWNAQEDAIDKYIHKSGHAVPESELGYWDVRSEENFGDVDDDSDFEDNHFKNWDVKEAAARKMYDVDDF